MTVVQISQVSFGHRHWPIMKPSSTFVVHIADIDDDADVSFGCFVETSQPDVCCLQICGHWSPARTLRSSKKKKKKPYH